VDYLLAQIGEQRAVDGRGLCAPCGEGEERERLFSAVRVFLGLIVRVAVEIVCYGDQSGGEIGKAGKFEVEIAQRVEGALDAPMKARLRLDEDARLGPAPRELDQRHWRPRMARRYSAALA
jgi:hypothetical protein